MLGKCSFLAVPKAWSTSFIENLLQRWNLRPCLRPTESETLGFTIPEGQGLTFKVKKPFSSFIVFRAVTIIWSYFVCLLAPGEREARVPVLSKYLLDEHSCPWSSSLFMVCGEAATTQYPLCLLQMTPELHVVPSFTRWASCNNILYLVTSYKELGDTRKPVFPYEASILFTTK